MVCLLGIGGLIHRLEDINAAYYWITSISTGEGILYGCDAGDATTVVIFQAVDATPESHLVVYCACMPHVSAGENKTANLSWNSMNELWQMEMLQQSMQEKKLSHFAIHSPNTVEFYPAKWRQILLHP